MHRLAGAGLEGGSPSLIWRRWTLPMWFAQLRVWEAHPPAGDLLRLLAAVHYPALRKPGKRRAKAARALPAIDTAKLHAPLSAGELAALATPPRRNS